MLKYYLYLLQVFGGGNPKINQAISLYGDAEKAYTEISKGNHKLLSEGNLRAFKNANLDKSEYIVERCKALSTEIISIDDKDYPSILKNIYNPPVILFVRGNLSCLDTEITLTVVGTRTPTSYSEKIGRKICRDLARLGVVMISGMAMGLDTVVHKAACEFKTPTIGVLACGIDIDYPKGSMDLRERIVLEGGAIVTELIPGTPCSANYFRERNRIMSGLGLGTFVIEASKSSGCLITADYAIEQGKDLFCIPPSDVFNPHYSGVISYLRDGAVCVFNHLDILNAYYAAYSHKLNFSMLENEYSQSTQDKMLFSSKKHKKAKYITQDDKLPLINVDNSKAPETKVHEVDLSIYSDNHKTIFDILLNGATQIEKIIELSEIEYSDICEILTDFEIDGIAERCPGAIYKLLENDS